MKQEKDIKDFFSECSGHMLPEDDGFMDRFKEAVAGLPVPGAFEKEDDGKIETIRARLNAEEKILRAETLLSVIFSTMIVLAGLVIAVLMFRSECSVLFIVMVLVASVVSALFMMRSVLPERRWL